LRRNKAKISAADSPTELLFLIQAARHWHSKLQNTVYELHRASSHSLELLERCRQLRAMGSLADAGDARRFVAKFTAGDFDGHLLEEFDKLSENQLLQLLRIVDHKSHS
jgi:hypothetical protein